MKKNLVSLFFIVVSLPVFAQIDAALFRYPDVSKTQIVFVYANDVWIMPKEGGMAVKLSSPPGAEIMPKFSPDGKQVAFGAIYDGNRDVYVLPVEGGVPKRLTSHGYSDRVVDWTNDGKSVLFASGRESGKARFSQFYTVPATGGVETKLPLAYPGGPEVGGGGQVKGAGPPQNFQKSKFSMYSRFHVFPCVQKIPLMILA